MDEKRPLIYSAISSHHFSMIMEKLYFQYKDGRNCDLEIRVTDGRIFAHKCLVDIFFTQAGADIDDDRFVLDMEAYDERIVTALLDMMYTGELCIQPHLIKDLQKAAFHLGFHEAEKGCRLYLTSSPRKGSESSDAPTPVTLVKVEPMDTGYENSENSEASSTEAAWPGGQEDLEQLAREYVQNLTSSSPSMPLIDSREQPSISSMSTSRNIYEVVKGKPQEHMKLPDNIVRKACEISVDHEARVADETALYQPTKKDPFLVVERSKDGTVLLKKEKRINRLSGGTKDVEEVIVYPKDASKIINNKRPGQTKRPSEVSKPRLNLDFLKKVGVVNSKIGSNEAVGSNKAAGTTSSGEASDSFDDDSSEEEGIYLENAEDDSVKKFQTTTKSGRTSKRPCMYGEGVVVKRKKGRPRKDGPLPKELEDKIQYEIYKHNRRAEQYEKRKKVVVDEKQQDNDELKLIPPAGIVPPGCKSRYGRPELMKTKFITETVQKYDGSLSVVTKEVPRRMTWHEQQADKKEAKAPTFVICHPTAPVVRP